MEDSVEEDEEQVDDVEEDEELDDDVEEDEELGEEVEEHEEMEEEVEEHEELQEGVEEHEELQEDVDMGPDDVAPPSTQPRRRKKSGPLPDEALEEAQAFGREVLDAAEELATRWQTSRRNILIAAALMLRECRAPNPKNKHAAWYAVHHPIPDDSKYLSPSRHLPLSKLIFLKWTPQSILRLCSKITAVAL